MPPRRLLARPHIDALLAAASSRELRAGTVMAQEARVGDFDSTPGRATTIVRAPDAEHEVVLRAASDGPGLAAECACERWSKPCRHAVAAALVLRQLLARDPAGAPDDVDARERALEERRLAAKRERLRVRVEEAPYLRVSSASGFGYRVHLRGGPRGPHSCDCPDFEANCLHSCKHVERVRMNLAGGKAELPVAHRKAAATARVYVHFGDIVEPRLHGEPAGRGSRGVRSAFGDDGRPRRTARDGRALLAQLASWGRWVEPEARAWVEQRLARRPELPSASPKALLPATRMTPYPYQVEGAMFLARAGRGLLADEMGLGKTAQAILAAAALRRARHPVRRVTVICPASLRGGWQHEIRTWLGEEAVLLEGSAVTRSRVIQSGAPWLVTHYEQVLRDHEAHRQSPPDLLIVDEAQRVKGLAARTARVVKAIPVRHVFALTGTPLENRLEEAYAIAQLVDQRLLPPLWQLERDHFLRDENGRRVVQYRNLDALRRRLEGAFLRRRKEDVALQLPERVRSVSFVPMHADVMPTYEDVMGQVARIVQKLVLLPADLDRLQRLLVIARRACNGPHMLGIDVDSRKVPKLAELRALLQDLCQGEGRKVVVFSEWTDMTDQVEATCKAMGIRAFHLNGQVPVKRRPALIEGFREHRGAAVFISTDAGGVGLNLQVADAVINLDLPWNPARLEQRIARVHRIGSKRTVNEILIVARHSVEHRILFLHETKRNVLANVWAKHGEDVIAAPGGSGAFRDMVKALCETEGSGDMRVAARAAELREPIEARPAQPAAPRPAAPPPPLSADVLASAVASIAPHLPPEHRSSLASVFRAIASALEE